MPIPHVDVKAQYAPLVPELKAAFERTLESGRFIFGPEVEAFEREAAEALGVAETVGVANGTDALVLVLDAEMLGRLALEPLDLGAEDEPAALERPLERGLQLGDERRVLRPDVNVGNRHFDSC